MVSAESKLAFFADLSSAILDEGLLSSAVVVCCLLSRVSGIAFDATRTSCH